MGVLAQPINALADAFDNFVYSIGNFFSNLTTSIGNWFNDVNTSITTWYADSTAKWQAYTVLFTGLSMDLMDKINYVLLEKLNPFHDNFILAGFMDWCSDTFSPASDTFFLTGFIDWCGDTFNSGSENFMLKKAFIPSDEFVIMHQERMDNLLGEKFAFIDGIEQFSEDFKTALVDDASAPSFNLTLPEKWSGKTVTIINFESFSSIRLIVKNLIRIFIWLAFIFKMYKKIPQIIY